MSFETMNTLCRPMMSESLVKLQAGGLHLHTRFQTVRGFGTTPHKTVNFFFDVDEWLIHSGFNIDRQPKQSKQAQV